MIGWFTRGSRWPWLLQLVVACSWNWGDGRPFPGPSEAGADSQQDASRDAALRDGAMDAANDGPQDASIPPLQACLDAVVLSDGAVDAGAAEKVELSQAVAPTAAYDGASDAYLWEFSPTTNYGSAEELRVADDAVSLLRFDLSFFDTDREVISVALRLFLTNTGDEVSIYSLNRAWSETEATWREFSSGRGWQEPGARGDSDQCQEIASVNPSSLASYNIRLGVNGASLVQRWIQDPSTNHGFLLALSDPDAPGADDARFISSNASQTAGRPRLVVELRRK